MKPQFFVPPFILAVAAFAQQQPPAPTPQQRPTPPLLTAPAAPVAPDAVVLTIGAENHAYAV